MARKIRIGRIPKDVKVGKPFTGIDASGNVALVRRSEENDFAQFNDINHPHAYGWWRYPLNTFVEQTFTEALVSVAAKFEDRSGESMYVTSQRELYS